MAVHLQIRANVSKNSINEALSDLGEYIVREIYMPELKAAAEEGRKAAEEGFAKAKYDGVNDVRVGIEETGPRSVELFAVGHALPYIEYGTGVFNKNNYYEDASVMEGKDHWFFSGRGRGSVQLTATGQVAHYKTEKKAKKRYYWVGPKGGKHYVSKNNPEILTEGGKRYWPGSAGAGRTDTMGQNTQVGNYTIQTELVPGEPAQWHEKPGSYYTMGNPPNNVMRHAKSVMMRQFYSKFKTKYSTYEP